jgi:pimeloyl-ACP methyl ester carboxylesterase
LVPSYDVKIAATMNGVDAARRVPPLWMQFDALKAKPVMVIRGANSDLLTAETVEAMRARRASMDVLEVPDQGHAPLLTDADTIGRICEFVHRCDRTVH